MRPVLLDLFCGAGGAAMGYYRAGFDIVGVDLVDQPNYPFDFIRGDALEYLRWQNPASFDAVHASPPCQRHSKMTGCRPGLASEYPDLIAPTREMLIDSGLPWVIENVPGAPLKDPITLCGTMFGRELYRHRLFESSVDLLEPAHPAHVKPVSRAGHWTPGTVMSVAGHIAPITHARDIMDIDWTNREELAEAIPPYYTELIGRQLKAAVAASVRTSRYAYRRA
jgi:DNA (cytosine-5)-methyltransferase 1